MSEAFSLHKVGTPGEPRLALFEVLQSVSQPFSLSFVVDTHYSHWKFMSHIPIYILSIIYVTIRCNSTQKYFRKLWVRYQGLLSCLKTVRFSLVWGREEPQHHTRIILYFVKKSSDSSLKALKGTLSTKRRQLHWRGLLACFSSHSFLQQNFERNTSIIQSPYKRIPAASCSPDNSSILFKLVCPGNISFLRHTANCVGLINITVSFLTCKIPVYNSVTQNTKLE